MYFRCFSLYDPHKRENSINTDEATLGKQDILLLLLYLTLIRLNLQYI